MLFARIWASLLYIEGIVANAFLLQLYMGSEVPFGGKLIFQLQILKAISALKRQVCFSLSQ